MLRKEEVAAEEERLRACATDLPDERRSRFYREVKDELRDPDTYAALNWLFLLGIHHFYLRRWGRAALSLGLMLMGVVLIVMGSIWPGISLIAAVVLFETWELFRSQVIVQDWNNAVFRRVLDKYRRE